MTVADMRKVKNRTQPLRERIADRKIRSDIEEFGFHVINVMEDDEAPPHSFSIGLYHSFNHPEVLIIGLKTELMQSMIEWMAEDIKKGSRYKAGKEYEGLLEGFRCTFRDVSKRHYDEYMGYAIWFYEGKEFPVNQCVWPTTKGYFPWEKEYPRDMKDWQPVLEE